MFFELSYKLIMFIVFSVEQHGENDPGSESETLFGSSLGLWLLVKVYLGHDSLAEASSSLRYIITTFCANHSCLILTDCATFELLLGKQDQLILFLLLPMTPHKGRLARKNK